MLNEEHEYFFKGMITFCISIDKNKKGYFNNELIAKAKVMNGHGITNKKAISFFMKWLFKTNRCLPNKIYKTLSSFNEIGK